MNSIKRLNQYDLQEIMVKTVLMHQDAEDIKVREIIQQIITQILSRNTNK
ncbi:hypothetical protein ACFPRB_11700 [Metabacillus niabensis]|uniref:Uncharacterized protein n=1 Tax=Metabacillus niabensis TaxID=324854 RepID=A0ABT9YY38_9BACI|nr:hypothetical protein [Metabacillus niabensis]MDQ0224903.1 hypothetical protein [Metabacillus niabensis]